MNAVAVNYYSGIKKFVLPVAVLLLGLVCSLLGFIWVWPLTIGVAVALVIRTIAKKTARPDRRFFAGLSFTFFVCAVFVGAFGFIAVAVAL